MQHLNVLIETTNVKVLIGLVASINLEFVIFRRRMPDNVLTPHHVMKKLKFNAIISLDNVNGLLEELALRKA